MSRYTFLVPAWLQNSMTTDLRLAIIAVWIAPEHPHLRF